MHIPVLQSGLLHPKQQVDARRKSGCQAQRWLPGNGLLGPDPRPQFMQDLVFCTCGVFMQESISGTSALPPCTENFRSQRQQIHAGARAQRCPRGSRCCIPPGPCSMHHRRKLKMRVCAGRHVQALMSWMYASTYTCTCHQATATIPLHPLLIDTSSLSSRQHLTYCPQNGI